MKKSAARPSYMRLLPLLVVVSGLSFTVRVGEFVTGVRSFGSANAQEEVKAEPPPIEKEDHGAKEAEIPGRLDLDSEGDDLKLKEEHQADQTGGEKKQADAYEKSAPDDHALPDPAKLPDGKAEVVEWKDAGDEDITNNAVKDELYKELSQRRAALEKREKEMAVREALLSAAERELDQKLRELNTIRSEIETAMKKQSDEEMARITSLVKIYEGMKPKDAASIFNTLDLDVLIVIMQKMSERKSAPILAAMNPERARTITIMMAEQKEMTALPEAN